MTGNRINLTENVLKRLIAEELHNVIHKKGNKWHIRGHHGDWNAEYDSKADAEKGLKAYFANKHINEGYDPNSDVYKITIQPYTRDFYGCVELNNPDNDDDVEFYNFNIRFKNGDWRIVWDLDLDGDFTSDFEPIIMEKFHQDYPDPMEALKA